MSVNLREKFKEDWLLPSSPLCPHPALPPANITNLPPNIAIKWGGSLPCVTRIYRIREQTMVLIIYQVD